MKKSKIFLIVAVLGFALSGCVYDFVAPEAPIVIDPDDPGAVVVSFENEIVPIFQAKCVGCHKAGGIKSTPDLTADKAYNSISGYVNTTTPAVSEIYKKPSPDGNHPAKYSTNEAALVLGWIAQGAENN
ncbi:hypothetical protein [uncultured Sunxiuqinia sp.]|uniref:hypothetical protein n=1 Tax=uncultured Sunxiuqinia sp. TaxID=1573825 RepID=UPI002AA659C3|nr:hypothetical protein [uncultured Sunxiuqinia sp.]